MATAWPKRNITFATSDCLLDSVMISFCASGKSGTCDSRKKSCTYTQTCTDAETVKDMVGLSTNSGFPVAIANPNKAQTICVRVSSPYLQQASHTMNRSLASASHLRCEIERLLSIVHIPQFLRASNKPMTHTNDVSWQLHRNVCYELEE